jgi:hypothetical protein
MFFFSWILWEFGDVFLIMLRSVKKNTLATRNFLVVTLGVQLGLTQLLLTLHLATPITLSLVMFLFCLSYFRLNRMTVRLLSERTTA